MGKQNKRELTPRRTARILALLTISQIRGKINKPEEIDINKLLLDAIRTLTIEVKSNLETASDELNRSHNQLLKSETRTNNVTTARSMLKESISLTQKAINRMGEILEIPTFVQLSHEKSVREYTLKLIKTVHHNRSSIDEMIEEVMVDWNLSRLSQIDSNIIRLAVAEMNYLNLAHKVAIDEAIEIAKEYSDDDGYRFINGVLRKVSDKLLKNQEKLTIDN